MSIFRGIAALGIAPLMFLTSMPALASGKGAPDELLGYWGDSPTQCRSFRRKTDDITIIDKETISWCGGSACEARIEYSRKKGNKIVLHLSSEGNNKGFDDVFKIIDEGIAENDGKTLVRCGVQDMIDGIGLPAGPSGNTKSYDLIFAAIYAETIPEECPEIIVNDRLAKKLSELGSLQWVEYLINRHALQNGIDAEKRSIHEIASREAKGAVSTDKEHIPKFCNVVIDYFGQNGRIIPEIILNKRGRL